jgi:hypothetical protein
LATFNLAIGCELRGCDVIVLTVEDVHHNRLLEQKDGWRIGNMPPTKEHTMADSSGGIGVMGVLVGAIIVIVVGTGLLLATGTIGSNSSTVKIELPKVTTK